jgi:peptidyl-tRNA hydrolase, PTH1 family
MKLIVGLGNPGIEYQFTPHNMGFLTIDRLAQELGIAVANRRCQSLTGSGQLGNHKVVLAKPETFMNLSGSAVRELVERVTDDAFDPKQDLIVVYDELDLPLGRIQIRERGGSAGHNGIRSILSVLGAEDWMRVRVGISPEQKPANGAKYVLSQFRKSEVPLFDDAVEKAAQAVRTIVEEGPQAAMNKFNRRPE